MESDEQDTVKLLDTMEDLGNSVYYSVHVPPDIYTDVDPYRNIFKNKQDALCLAKSFKKSRFKAFSFYHEAVDFAVKGQTFYDSTNNTVNNQKETHTGEKPVAFRGPKSQDLVKLRKAIENGDLTFVESTIWDNPRYLISSGDTPSILQEGSRYNAMHVAAKSKNQSMCELILNTVSNINFVMLLYGEDDNQDLIERSKILLDLYLNTPDKGFNETPLHFAVKFGAVDVVELLVSYPQCNKNVTNKFGKLPTQIICERSESVSDNVKKKIEMFLTNAFYVPVLRSEFNCTPPVIGEPFEPSSPPVLNEDPLQPKLEIHAYAGPMNQEAAKRFRKVWKTPPRAIKHRRRCKDLEKGLESVGRNLAMEYDVGWKEYWAFLDDFVDITSLDGLIRLENHLYQRVLIEYPDDSSTNTSSCNGSNDILSPISDLCKDFEACRLSGSNHYETRKQIPNMKIGNSLSTYKLVSSQLLNSEINPIVCIEKACGIFAHRISNDILNLLESNYSKTINELLEIDLNQLRGVVTSFMTDNRFSKIDYRFVHYHVASGIAKRLRESAILEDEVSFLKKTLEIWLEKCNIEIECFSSDEEIGSYRQDFLNCNNKKSTSQNQEIHCLLQHVLSILLIDNETHAAGNATTIQEWTDGKPCDCTWPKKTQNKRSTNKIFNRNKEDNISRQLFPNESEEDFTNCENGCDMHKKFGVCTSESEDSDADTFESAVCSEESDSEETFEDSVMPEEDIFIEGNIPTKMDSAVYNAVTCVKNMINLVDYPNIYKWYHAVSLYPESERQSWGISSVARCRINSPTFTATSTPTRKNMRSGVLDQQSPSSIWLKRIGLASPQLQRI